jgi:hypothetical protein
VGIVRSWLRGVLGASGVTLLVPAGLLVAVVVAAAVGGSGLGSVGQLIGGPEVPGAGAAVPSGERAVPQVPRSGLGAPGATARSAAAQSAARRAGGQTRPASGRRKGPGARTTTTSRQGTSTTQAPAPPVPVTASAPPPPPAAAQPAERNPVRRIGKAVEDLVRPLPLVGNTVAGAVGTVIDLVAPPGGKNAVEKILAGQ